jgi:hypothetical protein
MSKRPIFFATPLERIRRERRQRMISLWVSIVVFAALIALASWLLYLVKVTGLTASTGVGLAMAPVSQGMVFGLLLSLSVIGIVIAVRKVRQNEIEAEREDWLKMTAPPDATPPSEDARIVEAVRLSCRSSLFLVESAIKNMSVEDYYDALEVVRQNLEQVTRTLKELQLKLEGQRP